MTHVQAQHILTVTVESSSSPTVLRHGTGQAHAALRMLLSHLTYGLELHHWRITRTCHRIIAMPGSSIFLWRIEHLVSATCDLG